MHAFLRFLPLSSLILMIPQPAPLLPAPTLLYQIILHLLCVTRTNSYAVHQLADVSSLQLQNSQKSSGLANDVELQSASETVETYQQIKVAIALYPTSSFFNHDCRCNTHLFYQGNQLFVHAIQDIEKGSEVTSCYR